MKYYTIADIVEAIVANVKTGKWLSCTFPMQGDEGIPISVGVKAYGRWVQRIQLAGMCDGIPEQKTIKALRAEATAMLTSMVVSLNLKGEQ